MKAIVCVYCIGEASCRKWDFMTNLPEKHAFNMLARQKGEDHTLDSKRNWRLARRIRRTRGSMWDTLMLLGRLESWDSLHYFKRF